MNIGDRVVFLQDYRSLNNNTLLAPQGMTGIIRKMDAAKGRKIAISLENGKEIDIFIKSAHHYLKKV